jgi:hypothetical protein
MRWLLVIMVVGLGTATAAPSKAVTANTAGMRLYATKDYKAAAEQFRAAIKLDDSYVLAHYNLASMAALIGDKPTLIAQLTWLRASKDPEAAKVLAHAKADPDLKSVIDDADVKKLLEVAAPSCADSCMATMDACAAKCGKGEERVCGRQCGWAQLVCQSGCAVGMTSEGTARMRAWISGPLTGRDNDVAAYRVASVNVVDPFADPIEFTAYIKNQFGFNCHLAWDAEGNPTTLTACKAADAAQWSAKEQAISLSCTSDAKKQKTDCSGKFTLVTGTFEQPAEFVLRRTK